MTPTWRSVLRGAVIASGVAVTLAGVAAVRLDDGPIYFVFLLISVVLFLPSVEVLPRLMLGIPQMASTIGFLYIGGLPIVVLGFVAPALTRLLRWALPAHRAARVPQLEAVTARRDLFAGGPESGTQLLAEQSTFVLGLGIRWAVVSALVVPQGQPTATPWAMAVAEAAGYVGWGLLSILPIYPDRTLLPLSMAGGLRTVLTDIGLIVALAVTPFVFLIAYGFQTAGLTGAAAWALSTLGLHFMLKRLTERRLQVEDQNRRLEALNRELEHRERLSAIGKMSSVVSHQILQQLGVIGIYADLIRNAADAGDPPAVLAQARANAGLIEEALRDVNRVLTDLLVFSKDIRLNLYEQPLRRVIEECLDDCRAGAAARGVTLRADCAGDVTLLLDKLKMKQAIVNVVRNAVDASPPGGQVCVRAGIRDDDVDVEVCDQGAGVPAADREAVFTPFFTTKEHGTGLGLAIAREFTEAHGGRLWVEGRPNGPGARLVFRLPLRRSEVGEPR